jgi:TRAP-type C4-dicarboxylate transport system substrate-binding protein
VGDVDRLKLLALTVAGMTTPKHHNLRSTPVAVLTTLTALAAPGLAHVATASTVPPSAPAPLTLRVGTDDDDGRPAGAQILEFADQVATLSDGMITIEPAWHAAGDNAPHWDQAVAGKVTSGDLEMGLIPTRAWDLLDVTSLQALNTPFLVTRDDLVTEIVSGDVAGELMAGLDVAGVVGIALFPEGFRHPFAFNDALLGPDDYQGAVMRAPSSATTTAMFAALGATTNDDAPNPETHTALESSFLFDPPGTATGNVTFFPKVNSLVVNADVWATLSADQQAILGDAAAATREWAIGEIPSDHDAAVARCEVGFAVAAASDADIAALVDAVAPVVADLREDPATSALIDEITAMRDALPPLTDDPVVCDATTIETTPDSGSEASALNGVYRYEVTDEALIAAGVTRPAQIADNHGTYTWTLVDGTWHFDQVADNPLTDPSQDGSYVVNGDVITFSDPLFPPGEQFRFTQDADGNLTLEAVLVDDANVETILSSATWIRIGDPAA